MSEAALLVQHIIHDSGQLLKHVGDGDLDLVQECVQRMLRQAGKEITIAQILSCEHEGRNAKSALHRAALRGRAQILKYLLDINVNPDAVDDQGNTPLHLASDLGRAKAARYLLEAGADKNASNHFGRTPREMATGQSFDAPDVASGKTYIRRMFDGTFDSWEELPPEPDLPRQRAPVAEPTAPAPMTDAPSITLPDHESDQHAVDLMQVFNDGLAWASRLVEQATVPLQAATPAQRSDHEQLSDYDFVREVRVESLVRHDDIAGLKRWLSCKQAHEGTLPGATANQAILSAVHSSEEGPPGEDSRVALSALHLAALKGNVEMLRLMLDCHADANITNDQGSTPLHLAVDVDKPEAAQLLLHMRANPHAKNNFGRTPYDIREGRGSNLDILVSENSEYLDDWTVSIVHGPASSEECSICFETFKEGEQLRMLTCVHKYHAACIKKWLLEGKDKKCPTCMHPMNINFVQVSV